MKKNNPSPHLYLLRKYFVVHFLILKIVAKDAMET